jgi:hypothetical protein
VGVRFRHFGEGRKGVPNGGNEMKEKAVVTGLFALLLLVAPSAYGQFTAQEIAQRAQWEEYLQTAEITKCELIGEGVTKPWRLFLKKEGIEKKTAWKDVDLNLEGGPGTAGNMKSLLTVLISSSA